MPQMTPSEAMAEVLVQEGVNHVSGILGSVFMDMLVFFPAAGIDFTIDINPRHIARPHPVTVGVCADAKDASEELFARPRDAAPAKVDLTPVCNMVKAELEDWYREIAEITTEPTPEGRMHPLPPAVPDLILLQEK